MKTLKKAALFAIILLLTPLAAQAGEEEMTITDQVVGSGDEASNLAKVTVNYTGWLMDGTQFDSSIGKQPFVFTLGAGMVIPGWDLGVKGMKVGGKRELIIPPHLAYGKRGAGNVIPPGSKLRFQVELLAVAPPTFNNIDNAELKALQAKGIKLIDVRHPEEWQETGVVEGSILIESFKKSGRLRREFIEELAKTVKKDEPVILICRTGNRTAMLSEGLSDRFGYTNIYNVTNGIENWIKAGNPVVKP
ncbi:MAG: peptidylprolyl isomerase [Rhodospirillaceae bacterium]|jgi:rhodanese-related sulfurtransferase|nr:peptidylprolyl isomerase [Rhodospirillaceae bacterium]MBT5243545.1 peptidylprolyl isomerase [Rhodospirillaceae bacterium]MBT5562133.1 peptidylprolyl isomerase [Rhodospirillaceae bacterium]MBT6242306.1 peptidylprolyl isomerase [Rhodospirillaceae bacterium]MBT7137682.1 peptidylprolyl isomerase [Rhodospirillaceae bacterium]